MSLPPGLDPYPQLWDLRDSARVNDPAEVYVVNPASVPNANWLRPGAPSAGQQQFGARLLASHRFVLIPSSVSTHSWNLVFDCIRATGAYTLCGQEPFALDTRLHPPPAIPGHGNAPYTNRRGD